MRDTVSSEGSSGGNSGSAGHIIMFVCCGRKGKCLPRLTLVDFEPSTDQPQKPCAIFFVTLPCQVNKDWKSSRKCQTAPSRDAFRRLFPGTRAQVQRRWYTVLGYSGLFQREFEFPLVSGRFEFHDPHLPLTVMIAFSSCIGTGYLWMH